MVMSVSARRIAIEVQQFNALVHLIARGEMEGLHAARGGCVDGAFHLHGLKHHERCALLDSFARLDEQRDNPARHGRDETALLGVILSADFERIVERKDVRLTVEKYMRSAAD